MRVLLLLAAAAGAALADGYAEVLKACVREDGVDYVALRKERERLDRHVKALETAEAGSTESQRICFWINAYNALTLQRVLETLPESGAYTVTGVKEFWKGRTWTVAGRKVHLDAIEHEILRKDFREPRIHFAINCASRSCPPLAAAPYDPTTLDAALDRAARAYLADPAQNRFALRERLAEVSQIFEWFRGDFGDLPAFLAKYVPDPAVAESLRREKWTIRFVPYDWSLNESAPARHRKQSIPLIALFAVAAACLAAYGLHAFVLILWRRRAPAYLAALRGAAARSPLGREVFPRVLVQVPVYNEPDVVEGAIDAVAALEWARDALEIQVLDDSSDETSAIVGAAVARHRAAGVPIEVRRRAQRRGFKAGALDEGLGGSGAEFVAVFDADFRPGSDFLLRMVPLLGSDPRLAVAQARWEHVNREQNWLTRAQAVAVDAHFLVEQLGRAAAGKFLNFSGTAGVWRRAAIDDAGGWRGDTLTEDLDLSYRAQLRGWRIALDPGVAVPAELPPTLAAWKSQQRRWACGSMQCARKHLLPVWRARLPLPVKLEATAHLLGYAACIAMVALILLIPLGFGPWPLLRRLPALGPLWVAVLGPFALTTAGQRARGRVAPLEIVACFLLAVGGSANIAVAALRGLLRPIREFVRTPKRGAARPGGPPLLEVAMAALTCLSLVALWQSRPWTTLPYGFFCHAGFAALAIYWWSQEWRRGPA